MYMYVPVRPGDEDSPSRCLSERSCRRCMYRYARATRTLRAVAALLALHADELVSFHVLSHRRHFSFLPKIHTGLAFLSDVRAVVFVLAEEPVSARAKLSFLRGVVCLRRLLLLASSASSKCAWRGRRAGARGDGMRSRRQVGTVCLRDCLRPARYRLSLQKPRVAI